jgi:RNA polymerase sigma factor (sigma-70 family)
VANSGRPTSAAHATPAGGHADLEGLLALEEGRLFAIAFSILGDPAEAEDAVQETAAAAWRGWGRRREPERTRAWLTTICVHQALRRNRWRRRWGSALALGAERAQIDQHLEADGQHLDLHRAYRRLSRQQRAVVSLHYMAGYTLAECTVFMGCSLGTVSSHLSRALSKLREELKDE